MEGLIEAKLNRNRCVNNSDIESVRKDQNPVIEKLRFEKI